MHRAFLLIPLFAAVLLAQVPDPRLRPVQAALDGRRADEAIRLANGVLDIDPANTEAWRLRGLAKYQKKDFDGAIRDFGKALEMDPRNYRAFGGRAAALLAKGNTVSARRELDNAFAIEPRYAEGRRIEGDLQLALKQPSKVASPATKAVSSAAKASVPPPKVSVPTPKAATAAAKTPQTAKTATAKSTKAKPTQAAAKGDIPGLSLQVPSLPVPKGDPWCPPGNERVVLDESAPPLALPVNDPSQATKAIPLAQISFAMESMKTLAGSLNSEQERAFATRWQAFFDHPSPEVLGYFEKLNPVLSELQAVQAAANQAAQDFDAAWAEAVLSHAAGDPAAAAGALAQAERHTQTLKSAQSRAAAIQKKAQTLGNPPDPVAAKAKAREWSRKWTQGANPELAKTAYLWRVAQMSAKNADGFFAASTRKEEYVAFWPADEATWTTWFNGGKQGKEPSGPRDQELIKKANSWSNEVYDANGVGPCLRIHFFQNISAEVAAKQIVDKGKVRPWRLPGFTHDDEKCTFCKGKATDGVAPAATSTAVTQTKASQAEAEQAQKLKLESIAEKEDLIRSIQNMLAKDEAEWSREKDPKRKEDLYLRVLNGRSSVLQEQDLLRAIKTGEYAHTRTPSEAYCHDLMIVRTVEHMRAVEETRRLAAAVEKMASRGEPDQVAQLQEFVARQISAKDLAEGNSAKVREVAKAVHNTVQGRREQQLAKHLEDAIDYEDYELRAQRVKTISSLTLLVTGMAAPAYAAGSGTLMSVGGTSQGAVTAVNVVYGATTGTIEGGPVEGVKQAVAQIGLPGMVASEMMTGYQRGGLVSSGGVTGALERGVEAFLGGKLVEGVAGKAGAWWSARAKGTAAPALSRGKPGLTVDEFIEGQTFQLAKNQAQFRLKQYQETASKIAAARKSGASAAEIAALEAKRLQQAAKINEDFLAKRILKAEGKAARTGKGAAPGSELEQDYAQAIDTVLRTQVDPAFNKAVRGANFHWRKKAPGGSWQRAGELKFKDMRHGDAGKTVNTDRDLALEEMRSGDGEVWQLYKGDKPVDLSQAEQELQQLYNSSYAAATGGNPLAAMQNVTTSRSLEAYKDLAYTKLNDPANVSKINKGWAGQAEEVLKNKVTHAGAGQGELTTLVKKIDGANQAAKDIDKRLLPLLKANRAKSTGKKGFELDQDMERWTAIQRALERVEQDPVGASRQLRVLTGMDSIGEVTDLVGKAFLGVAKLQ